MNKLLTVAGALLACTLAWAQNTVLDVKPAHDGKNLTMEEAIYKGVGYSRIRSMFFMRFGCRMLFAEQLKFRIKS